MISKRNYVLIYFLGFIVGPALSFLVFASQAYDSFLFWWGMGHMAVLILAAFFVEEKYKTGAGIDTQYAGYVWTLIGVAVILISFRNQDRSSDLLRIFLHGAGLAVGTSILGWRIAPNSTI
jgi:uncharacterized protein YqgC (DUF456 family)